MRVQTYPGFLRPFAINQDRTGRIFVANFIHQPSVGIFTSSLELIGWLTENGLRSKPDNSLFVGPHSIDFDSDGKIYITDYRAKRILKFSKDGDYLGIFLSADKMNKSFLLAGPATAYFDPKGDLIVSDFGSNSIQKFSIDGSFLGWLGAQENDAPSNKWQENGAPIASKKTGGFDRPHAVAFDHDNSMYVVDTWNHRIQKFSQNGEFISSVGVSETNAAGGFSAPVAISIEDKSFVVSEYGNSRVQKFSLDGEFMGWIGTGTNGQVTQGWSRDDESQISDRPGGFHHPYDLKLKNGRLLVADSDNNRIQIITF